MENVAPRPTRVVAAAMNEMSGTGSCSGTWVAWRIAGSIEPRKVSEM
jgi:hypothetical protein